MMAGESGKRRDEAVYRYYKCSGVKRKLGCDKKTVRKSWIEDIVVEEIKRLVHDDNAVAYRFTTIAFSFAIESSHL